MPVIALAGNPNSGKTTLFNALTGERRATGNWPGVTVEKREGRVDVLGKTSVVIDLPGAYSLSALTSEEKVTEAFLSEGRAEMIVNVINPLFLSRELRLTHALMRLKKPMLLALTKPDEAEKAGVALSVPALSEVLGIPAVVVSGKTGEGLEELKKYLLAPPPPPEAVPGDVSESIRRALKFAGYVCPGDVFARTKALDKWFLGRRTAFPLLAAVLFSMLFFAFGAPGRLLTAGTDRVLSALLSVFAPALHRAPEWMQALLTDGVFTGIFSVMIFLPQVAVLYFFTAFIEESGYMARAAFITDRLLRKIGLSGRSMIPLMMGLGCTTAAVSAVQGVNGEKDRRMTVMLAPFVSCGAKMPVYAMLSQEFFPRCAPVVIFSVYLAGFLALAAAGALINRLLYRREEDEFFIELPPYTLPDGREILKRSISHLSDFTKRAGSIILLTSAGAWFLSYYSPALLPAASIHESILSEAGRKISFLFRPLGFGSWQAVSALISGVFAKESILSCLRILSEGEKMPFTPRSAYSFLLFILLSPPCASALAAVRRSLQSTRLFLLMLFLQLALAFSASVLVVLL